MAIDETNLSSIALGLVGEEPLTAIADTTKAGIVVRTMFEQSRNEIFDLPVNWKFATTRATLSQMTVAGSAVTPDFGWDYQYGLPPLLRRIIGFVDENGDHLEYQYRREIYLVGSNQIPVLLTNQDECRIKYLALLTNVGLWPGWFCKLVYLNIAIKITKPLTKDSRQRVNLVRLMKDAYREAKSANGMEDAEVDSKSKNLDWGNMDVVDAPSAVNIWDPRYFLRED